MYIEDYTAAWTTARQTRAKSVLKFNLNHRDHDQDRADTVDELLNFFGSQGILVL